MNKKILEVCLSPGLGGLELFALQCYKEFSKKEDCYLAIAPGTKLDNYITDIVPVYITRNILVPFFSAYKLAQYIDAMDIDILHFHWNKDMVTVVLAKLLSKKKPAIVLSRHMGMTRFKNDPYHKFFYKHISKIHAVSREVKEQLIQFIPKAIQPQIKLIYLGVEVKEKIDITPLKQKHHITNEFIVGIIGRIQDGKGQHKVIKAISGLKNLNIKLLIIGDTMDASYLEQLHQMCHDLHIEDKVIFTGFTKETDAYMQLCDVTVLASEYETFGLVIIESMANGTPVIATNKGGPLEIIDDEKDGLLTNRNSKNLQQKITLLYHDHKLIKLLSTNCINKINSKFNATKQLTILYDYIQE